MLMKEAEADARRRTIDYLNRAGIVITPHEERKIKVADFGLGELEQTGVEVLTYVNNEHYCAKELILFPGQTCPEHRHPPLAGGPGKQETYRVRWGEVYLYVAGPPTSEPLAQPPAHRRQHYTVWHQVVLRPGEQYTSPANTLHWFQGGPEGAVVTEFSSQSVDEKDIFTDPEIGAGK